MFTTLWSPYPTVAQTLREPSPEVDAPAVADGNSYEALTKRRLSDLGKYSVWLRSNVLPVPVARLHSWTFHIETLDGQPFIPDELTVAGGMPGHGHGFPSKPSVTRYLASGNFLVDGVKFNMAGKWLLRFGFRGPAGWDTATFEFELPVTSAADVDWESVRNEIIPALSLSRLPELPRDLTNRVADDPGAQALGRRLFFDTGLSRHSDISCASCHAPGYYFTDPRPRSQGIGETARHSLGLLGVGYGAWFYWDGRRDSLWAQALTPIETAEEMGATRVSAIRHVLLDDSYRRQYATVFGDIPDRDTITSLPADAGPFGNDGARTAWSVLDNRTRILVNTAFSNVGKAIAAFERQLIPGRARFDEYADAIGDGQFDESARILTADERAGLHLFIDSQRTQCLRCHNGPLFSNGEFHNIGTGEFEAGRLDYGRLFGVRAALYDEFNCLGEYSDAGQGDCTELQFLNLYDVPASIQGAFKVPTLRNVADTPPYMHDARFDTLEEVIAHYRSPPSKASSLHELEPLDVSDEEARQLVAFLKTLSGGGMMPVDGGEAPQQEEPGTNRSSK